MNKKIIAALLLVVGFSIPVATATSAKTKSGNVNGIGVSGVLSKSGSNFMAGTYANQNVDYLWVSLDGENEWWADSDDSSNAKSCYVQAAVGSVKAWSDHEADDNDDQWNTHISYRNGSFS